MSDTKQEPDISIENVVASATLDQRMDLPSIMMAFRTAEYRPKRFPGLVFRLKRPKTATLIFGSGKMVCTGAKREKQVYKAMEKISQILEDKNLSYTRGAL